MAFSPGMQAKLETRDRRLAARVVARQGIQAAALEQAEAEQQERREIVGDAQEAASLARDVIRENVCVDLESYGMLTGWRITQHEYNQNVRRDYGPTFDRAYGAIDAGGPEYNYEPVGTNELILAREGGLWYVAHNAYFISSRNNHPPIVPPDSVIEAGRCTEDSFGEWSTKLASLALYNFIDNNRLMPFTQDSDQQTGATS